jgi:hypothetical protein
MRHIGHRMSMKISFGHHPAVYSVTVRTCLYCAYLLVYYVSLRTWVYGALEIVDTWGAAPTISRDKRRQPLKSGWEYSFHWKEKTGKVVECPYILYGPILRNFATLPGFSVSSLLSQPDNMCLIVRIRTYVRSRE